MLNRFRKVDLNKRISHFTNIAKECKFDQKIPLLLSQPLMTYSAELKNVVSAILSNRLSQRLDLSSETELADTAVSNMLKDLVKDNVGNVVEIGDGLHPELTKSLTDTLHKYLSESGFINHIGLIQKFPNIRIKIGPYSAEQEHSHHPLSTSKLHCDIWAGAPATLLICIIELVNINNGPKIEFANIKSFPLYIAKKLPAYDHPTAEKFLRNNVTKIISSELNHIHVLDTYTPHRTVYPGEGLRVSVDFRIALNESLSVKDSEFLRSVGFCSPVEFA